MDCRNDFEMDINGFLIYLILQLEKLTRLAVAHPSLLLLGFSLCLSDRGGGFNETVFHLDKSQVYMLLELVPGGHLWQLHSKNPEALPNKPSTWYG